MYSFLINQINDSLIILIFEFLLLFITYPYHISFEYLFEFILSSLPVDFMIRFSFVCYGNGLTLLLLSSIPSLIRLIRFLNSNAHLSRMWFKITLSFISFINDLFTFYIYPILFVNDLVYQSAQSFHYWESIDVFSFLLYL